MAVNVFTRMEVSSINDVEKVIITLDQQSQFELLNNWKLPRQRSDVTLAGSPESFFARNERREANL